MDGYCERVEQPTVTISDAIGDFETCEDAMEARAQLWAAYWKAGQERLPALLPKLET